MYRALLLLWLLLGPAAVAGPERFLTLPPGPAPLDIQVAFHLFELNEIDDEAETFQFSGLYTLTWKDSRQAFDPAAEGIPEKLYSGNYQFDEVSPAWYPQLELINGTDLFEKRGTVLRVAPDGTCRLTESLAASAETPLYMRRYPFDHQRLRAQFQVLGYNSLQVRLVTSAPTCKENLRMSQWAFQRLEAEVLELAAPYTGGNASTLVLSVDVRRLSMFAVRLVMLPMGLIVMATWVVFWMERSAPGDQINVSFVGILTVVAYQMVLAGIMPQISYVTFMNGFINLCFVLTTATVVINLRVAHLENSGRQDRAHRLETTCRWLFPLLFVGLSLGFGLLAILLF